MIRIISGEAKGRKIEAPPAELTRPLMDRAKESIFNMLFSLGGVEGLEIQDIFAGSGSFGLECLSRGANHVTFVESSPIARKVLDKNLAHLGFEDRATIVSKPAEEFIKSAPACDLAFCDPPYAQNPWTALLNDLKSDVVVGHSEFVVELPDGWEELKRKKYGRAQIFIAKSQPEVE